MVDNNFAKEQLRCMYKFRELSQNKRMETRKLCLGALSALPIAVIVQNNLFANCQPIDVPTFHSNPIIIFAAFASVFIVLYFWLFELILSTQEGILDDKMWRLEEELAKDSAVDLYSKGLLCRSRGEDEKNLSLKLGKFTNALSSEEIALFYGVLLILPLRVLKGLLFLCYAIPTYILFLLLIWPVSLSIGNFYKRKLITT